MRPRFLLLTALLGIAGCAGANHLSFQRVKEIQLGTPGIEGKTLHIPMQTNNGRGFVQPVQYLCGVTTTGHGHRIGFSLQHCLGTGPPYIMGARIYFPVLSVPYNGPSASIPSAPQTKKQDPIALLFQQTTIQNGGGGGSRTQPHETPITGVLWWFAAMKVGF